MLVLGFGNDRDRDLGMIDLCGIFKETISRGLGFSGVPSMSHPLHLSHQEQLWEQRKRTLPRNPVERRVRFHVGGRFHSAAREREREFEDGRLDC